MLEVGGPINPPKNFSPQQLWVGVAMLAVLLEVGIGIYLYRRVHLSSTTPTQSVIETPVDQARVLNSLTPTTVATTVVQKKVLQSITPPPTPPVSITTKQEQDILKSLTPRR